MSILSASESAKLRQRLEEDQDENRAKRRYERYECFAIALMISMERMIPIEGVVNEISVGGIRFRPASTYMLDRTGTDVTIVIDEVKINGKIRATHPDGYGIQFFENLDDSVISGILTDYGDTPEEMSEVG